MLGWNGLLIVLGFVTVLLGVYMLITRSAGIYSSPRHFWTTALLSAGLAYLLSGGLFLFLHLNATVAVAVSAIVPFLVDNLDLGNKAGEQAPSGEGLETGDQQTDDEEDEAGDDSDDGEDEEIEADGPGEETPVSNPREIEPLWN